MIELGDIDLMRSQCGLVESFVRDHESAILEFCTEETSEYIVECLFSEGGLRLLVFDGHQHQPLLYTLSWENFVNLYEIIKNNPKNSKEDTDYETEWYFEWGIPNEEPHEGEPGGLDIPSGPKPRVVSPRLLPGLPKVPPSKDPES